MMGNLVAPPAPPAPLPGSSSCHSRRSLRRPSLRAYSCVVIVGGFVIAARVMRQARGIKYSYP